MKTYTLTEHQVKSLLRQAFQMGYQYTMDMVNNTERNAWNRNMLDHEHGALNDICEDVLSETPEVRASVRIFTP